MTQAAVDYSARDDNIVEGSLWKAIWLLSWPMLIRMAAASLASFSDVAVAGRLGSNAQAVIGICGQIWFFLLMIIVAISAGTTAMVSRYWGAKDLENAGAAAKYSMLFAIGFGVITVTAGFFLSGPILRLLGASTEVVALGWRFMQVDIFSQFPFAVLFIAHAIFRAKGDAKGPMFDWIVMAVLIVFLNWLLALQLGMGVLGIATSWVVASSVAAVMSIVRLRRSELARYMRFLTDPAELIRDGISIDWLTRLVRIGIPASISDLAWTLGCFSLFLIFSTTSNPTACQASWSIGLRVEEVASFLPLFALSTAASTIVGQNLGAGNPDRASMAGWRVCSIGFVYGIVVSIVMFLGAVPIASLLSADGVVQQYTIGYLQVIGLCQPFVAFHFILFGAMQGAGYTRWPMWASILCLVLIRLPLAWFLTKSSNENPFGCWMAISISTIILGMLAIWRFKSRAWQVQTI